MPYRRRLHLLTPTLLAIAVAGAAEPAPDALEITATRLEADPFEQPYAMYQVDRAAVDESNSRTMIDSIDRTPGVFIQRTAGNQASPYIRGLTGQQTLLMFDGVRLNTALFRSGPNQYSAMIPDEAVGRVDVILGTGTTVLGSDGLTGAIDFRLAEAGRGQEKAISPWARARTGSAEDGGSVSGGLDGRIGDWAYSFEGAFATYGDLEGGSNAGDRLFGPAAGDTTIPNVGYDQYSLGGRIAYLGIDGQRLELAGGHVEQSDAARPDGYYENSGVPSALSRYYDPQVFEYVHLRHIASDLGPWDRTSATLWFHRHHEQQIREDIQNYGDPANQRYRRREYDDEVTTLGGDLQLTNRVGRHEVTYGATMYQDRISSEYQSFRAAAGSTDKDAADPYQDDTTNPELSTAPDGTRFTGIAGFAQDFWRFADRWSVLAGARYDHVSWILPITPARAGYADFPADEDLKADAEAVTGNLRLAWNFSDPWMTWTGIGQGFRTPTASDLAGTLDRASSSSGASSGPQTEGNPELEPETSLTLEWGTRFEQDEDSASLNLFYTWLEDLITTRYIDVDGDGDISDLPAATNPDRAVRDNASKAYLRGGEVAFDLGIPLALPEHWRLSVFQATSLVEGEALLPEPEGDVWQNISRANTLTGKAGLRIGEKHRWYGLLQVRWADGYDSAAPSDANDVRMTVAGDVAGRMPGWAVLDLKAGVSDPAGAWRCDVGAENLGNITYRQTGSGADGAGLNLVASAQVRF